MNITPKILFIDSPEKVGAAQKFLRVASTVSVIGLDVEFRPKDEFISPEWRVILDGDDEEARDKLIKSDAFKLISFDVRKTELVTLQIGILQNGDPYCLEFDVQRTGQDIVAELVKPVLNRPDVLAVAQNATTEYKWLKYHLGVQIDNWWDTMYHERVKNAGSFESNGLGAIRARMFPEHYTLEDATEEKETTRLSFIYTTKPLTSEQRSYAARDATDILFVRIIQMAREEGSKLQQIALWEDAIIPVVGDMELTGIYVNSEEWLQLTKEARIEARRLYDQLQICFIPKSYRKLMGNNLDNLDLRLLKTCDPDSPIAMAKIFIEHGYKLNIGGTFRKNQWVGGVTLDSTGEDVLIEYRRMFVQACEKAGVSKEVIEQKRKPFDLLLQYRTWSQRVKTFGEEWLTQAVNDVTGFVHCRFNQYGADSGRFSCQNPNLQQVPSRGKFSERYRKCFQARPGYIFVDCDWSQLESRILAAISKDSVLIEVFNKGWDLHTMSAARFLSQEYDDLVSRLNDKENPEDAAVARGIRTLAKTVGFGVVYGMGAKRLSIQTVETDETGMGKPAYCSLTREDIEAGQRCNECARCALVKYKETYKDAMSWLENMKKVVLETWEAEDMGGGRRLFSKPDPDRIRYKFIFEKLKKDKPELKKADQEEVDYEVMRAMNARTYFDQWELDKAVNESVRAQLANVQREAANHPIQGTNARMLKIAMRKVWDRLKAYDARIVLVVHDEILVEVKIGQEDIIGTILQEEMQAAAQYFIQGIVPTPAEPHTSPYWSK